jgi:hypothetical protein
VTFRKREEVREDACRTGQEAPSVKKKLRLRWLRKQIGKMKRD